MDVLVIYGLAAYGERLDRPGAPPDQPNVHATQAIIVRAPLDPQTAVALDEERQPWLGQFSLVWQSLVDARGALP